MRNPICYIGGNSFPNIFGAHTACHYGQVIHCLHLHPSAQLLWPWMQRQYEFSSLSGATEYFNTWEECKQWLLTKWPNATFEIHWEEFTSSFPDAKLIADSEQ